MSERMDRVICDITIAADGYSAGLNQTEERPFGPVRGGWDRQWNGWWGGDPPFHAPSR